MSKVDELLAQYADMLVNGATEEELELFVSMYSDVKGLKKLAATALNIYKGYHGNLPLS